MTMGRTTALVALLLGSSVALAGEDHARHAPDEDAMAETDRPTKAKRKNRIAEGAAMLTKFGGLFTLGGGFGGFVESDLTAATGNQGTWEARAVIGTRSPVAVEAAYIGSAQNIDALGLSSNSGLVGNGLEGALRLNVPISQKQFAKVGARRDIPALVEPYAFGGLGWKHYSLLNEGANTSNVQESDDIMTVPLGVGLALGLGGITVDGRFTYRHAFFSDLVGNETSSFGDASLNQWQLGANIGFEF